jgi:hypothetical protein
MPKFAEGTEYVNGAGTAKSDSIHAKLSKGERVVDAFTNEKLKGISNKELPKAVSWYNMLKINGIIPTKETNNDNIYMKQLLEVNEKQLNILSEKEYIHNNKRVIKNKNITIYYE